jgi:hypothetical protein
MKNSFIILALVCLAVGAQAGDVQLHHVLAPQANWLNPNDGSYIDIFLTTGIEVESSVGLTFLVGLPFETTSLTGASVKTAAYSCSLESASFSSASTWSADNAHTSLDGLNYFWVSSSVSYVADYYIQVRLYLDLPSSAGWYKPMDIALTTCTSDDYMILAQNTNVMPVYVLDAPSEGLTLADATTDTKKSTIGSTFTSSLQVTTSVDCRRLVITYSGYSLNAAADTSLILYSVDEYAVATLIDSDEYEAELSGSSLHIRWANNSEYITVGTYQIDVSVDIPLKPTSASINVLTMDKYGPRIIEKGSLTNVYSSSSVGWASNYPKIRFGPGLDASNTDLKESYGLYTLDGTSLVYNHLVISLKETTYAIPDGSQTLTITIGSSSVSPTCAQGTLVHNIAAASGSTVSCACSSYYLVCTGTAISKGTEISIGLKVAYTGTSKMTDFGKAVLTVDGTTVVTGTPVLKTSFTTPHQNTSPLAPGKWGTYATSALASTTIDETSVTINSENIINEDAAFEIDADYNGLRHGDGQYLYMYSRIGPYHYYTSSSVSTSKDPTLMYLELTLPKDISATWEDDDVDNMYAFLIEMGDGEGKLASELVLSDYWNSDELGGWLYMAVEREICDADLNGSTDTDTDERICVDWYCYQDYDGDGSYDSPQPCRPIRPCTGTEVGLLYPELSKPFHTYSLQSLRKQPDDSGYGMRYNTAYTAMAHRLQVNSVHTNSKECRPVPECDITDVTAGSAVYMTKHSSGMDCIRNDLPYCTDLTNMSDGILAELSDGSTSCEEVPACDVSTSGSGTLNSRLDGAYCNPITESAETMCDAVGGKNSQVNHGYKMSDGSADCVSVPLCTYGDYDEYSTGEDLTELHVSGADCITVPEEDVCDDWLYSDNNAAIQSYPGLNGASGSSTSCYFLPACNAAADEGDPAWLTAEHVEGKACTMDVPICNGGLHRLNYNAPLFLSYAENSPTSIQDLSDYGLTLVAKHNDRGESQNCIMLDACDTFGTGNLNREREDGKACYKATSTISDLEDRSDGSDGWGSTFMTGFTWTQALVNVPCNYGGVQMIISRYSHLADDCVPMRYCNAENDDEDTKMANVFGTMNDCVTYPGDVCGTDDATYFSWGIQQKRHNSASFSYTSESSTYYAWYSYGNKDSDLWQVPCTVRTDKKGDVDANPYGMSCLTINSEDICTADGPSDDSGATWYDSSYWTVYESTDNDGSDCIRAPTCYFNSWIAHSKYNMHARAYQTKQNKDITYSWPHWQQYTWNVYTQDWITEGCVMTKLGSNTGYVGVEELSDEPRFRFDYDEPEMYHPQP